MLRINTKGLKKMQTTFDKKIKKEIRRKTGHFKRLYYINRILTFPLLILSNFTAYILEIMDRALGSAETDTDTKHAPRKSSRHIFWILFLTFPWISLFLFNTTEYILGSMHYNIIEWIVLIFGRIIIFNSFEIAGQFFRSWRELLFLFGILFTPAIITTFITPVLSPLRVACVMIRDELMETLDLEDVANIELIDSEKNNPDRIKIPGVPDYMIINPDNKFPDDPDYIIDKEHIKFVDVVVPGIDEFITKQYQKRERNKQKFAGLWLVTFLIILFVYNWFGPKVFINSPAKKGITTINTELSIEEIFTFPYDTIDGKTIVKAKDEHTVYWPSIFGLRFLGTELWYPYITRCGFTIDTFFKIPSHIGFPIPCLFQDSYESRPVYTHPKERLAIRKGTQTIIFFWFLLASNILPCALIAKCFCRALLDISKGQYDDITTEKNDTLDKLMLSRKYIYTEKI